MRMAEIFKTVTLSEDIVFLKPLESKLSEHISVTQENSEVINSKQDELTAKEKEDLFQSAFSKGLQEGLEQAKNQMEEQTTLLNTLLNNIPNAISENRLHLSHEIADIVLVIAQQFFINQQNSKESISLQINQIINQLNDKQDIELSLHPQDLSLLQQGQLKINLNQCSNLRVIADESLKLGGCLIKSEHGVFDAGIERQIDRLKQVLLQIKQGGGRE